MRTFFWIGLALLGPSLAGATVARQMSVEALTAEAVYVVHADVVDRYTVEERGLRGEIYTRTVLDVRRYLKGDGPRQLVVEQLGGQLGTLEMHVAGTARLEPGDEVVAFLAVEPERQLAFVVALAQGVFQVRRGSGAPTIWRDLSGISFYGARLVVDPTATLAGLTSEVGR